MVRCFLGKKGAPLMGFDPRHWSPQRATTSWESSASGQRVTSNVEALLRENDALRREVKRLQQELELERVRRVQCQQPSAQAPARITAEQVQAWSAALARQPGWSQLRQSALEGLIDQLNRNSFPSRLSLQQRLDRLVSGLGTDLLAAVGPRTTKKTVAVMAAFALYGVRASEWLDEDPARVVSELRQRTCSCFWERRGGGAGGVGLKGGCNPGADQAGLPSPGEAPSSRCGWIGECFSPCD